MGMHVAIRDDGTLGRIAATLIALAALAERAGARSHPVRCLVLWILRRAEAVAREFVAEATRTPPPVIEGIIPEIRNGPADAILLAWRFRVLAAALGALLCPAHCSPCRSARPDRALRDFAPRSGLLPLGGWTRKPNDTS